MHNKFTLYFRKVPSGKRLFYYYAYDDEGKRLGPWATGQASKTAARNFCINLVKHGKLFPGPKEMPTFSEYSVGFWDWEKSAYLKDRKKRRKLTRCYTDKSANVVEHTLIPYFGNMKLDKITGEIIDKWLDHMINKGKRNTTINGYYGILMTMIKYAVKKRVIERDPFMDVQRLMKDRREKKIITQDEFKALFVDDWKTVWNNDFLRCTANKLAALTGMRICEVLGLKGEFVFDDHIFLCAQHDNKYGYRDTKTKIKHHIPLAAELIKDLRKLMRLNGNGFLFSLNKGESPISRNYVFLGLQKALLNIGVSEEERKERGINVHAWRHFANTELQKGGLTIQKVQAVTGHKSDNMTEHYTHFDPLEFGDVPKIQAELLKPKIRKPETAEDSTAIRLVKTQDENSITRKRKVS